MSYPVAAKPARSGQLTGRWTRGEHEAFLAGLEEHVRLAALATRATNPYRSSRSPLLSPGYNVPHTASGAHPSAHRACPHPASSSFAPLASVARGTPSRRPSWASFTLPNRSRAHSSFTPATLHTNQTLTRTPQLPPLAQRYRAESGRRSPASSRRGLCSRSGKCTRAPQPPPLSLPHSSTKRCASPYSQCTLPDTPFAFAFHRIPSPDFTAAPFHSASLPKHACPKPLRRDRQGRK